MLDKKLKIKIVNKDHFICDNTYNKELGPSIKRFWKTRQLNYVSADKAIIVTDNGKIIAFFRYMVGTYTHYLSIGGLGTYVLPKYRKLGLATKMWDMALKDIQPAFVVVTITSKSFVKFLNSLKKKRPTTIFYTAERF